jgi:hypothetical protein
MKKNERKNTGKGWVDFRNKKRGKYVIFYDTLFYDPGYGVSAEIYSGLRPALKNMKATLRFDQSLHDASGRLIAWVENHELVMLNELKVKAG